MTDHTKEGTQASIHHRSNFDPHSRCIDNNEMKGIVHQDRPFDISVVVTAHREGRIAHRTMRSLYASIEYAEERGASIEVVVVMDRPDQATKDCFLGCHGQEIAKNTIVQMVDFGDPGLSRNHGVQCSRGTYVAILDADDLFGKTWLHKSLLYFENYEENIILHPRYQVVFGEKHHIFQQISVTEENFKAANLFENNYWDSQCIAKKEVFLKCPYQCTSGEWSGFGYEDWHFNCETLASGINHYVCPETVTFKRAKKPNYSILFAHSQRGLTRPTRLFDPKAIALMQVVQVVKDHEVPPEPSQIKESALNRLRQFLDPLIFHTFKTFPELYRLYARLRRRLSTERNLPDWLIAEWKEIHSIEPQLFPQASLIQNILIYEVPDSSLPLYYKELCRLTGENVSHVFLVPWLQTGGADLVALNYIRALVTNNLARGIVVIATENQDSSWASRLPVETRFIDFGKLCFSLRFEEQKLLLAKFLLQFAPRVIHNINSMLGFAVFEAYGKALSTYSNLYASTFCADIDEEGRSVGYAFSHLTECFDYLKAVTSDNKQFLRHLRQMYLFEKSKLYTHYQPIKNTPRRSWKAVPHKQTLDVLWAGRLDRQKRPDLLIGIARTSRHLPFKFHVYGSALLDRDSFTDKLSALTNLEYCGPYDEFASLHAENFDVFLYTSQWDGLPNVLLEAAASQIPIIASDVGGISELITHGETGFLVSPFDAIDEFVKWLTLLSNNESLRKDIANNAYELVSSRHSWANFTKLIKEIPDYCSFDLNDIWNDGLPSEVEFWRNYLHTRGGSCHAEKEFQFRFDPEAPLQEWACELLPTGSEAVRILDVGAGPATWLGKKVAGRKVEIVAIDPLGDVYNKLMAEDGVPSPSAVTITCAAEDVLKHFESSSFDLVFARNSIDHARDAFLALENVFKMVRPGGALLLVHKMQEGRNQSYLGLHQWDFILRSGELFISNHFQEQSVLALSGGTFRTTYCKIEGDWIFSAYRRVC
jgi:glycosyltransferase involved in cell wall biosynthesis/SAM-dependent methyltransferase